MQSAVRTVAGCRRTLHQHLLRTSCAPTHAASSRVIPGIAAFRSHRCASSAAIREIDHDEGDSPPVDLQQTPIKDALAKPTENFARWQTFADRLDPVILGTLKTTFKYDTMTKVQESIVEKMPLQNDLLVRSKTGTGKTLAFLIPALQRALDNFATRELSGTAQKTYANRNASVLIISPTRELANQIATEARRLVTTPGSNMKALCVVGGDSKRDQLRLMRRERNDFVVGTPGRLLDLLENDPDFADLMGGVQTLILDEADTLLEMGFRKELERIIHFIPRERQTYMFSATVSRDIQNVARLYLDRNHEFLNTVGKDEQDVHTRIKQEFIIRPNTEHLRVVLSLIISQQLKDPMAKIIVFLPTTKMTMLYAAAFKVLRRLYPNPAFQQFDIHAQRSQDSRTKVSKAFREARAGSVLFTTDVSARGVDYPGVSQVIQVGAANSRDLYIHRVGRTGRAGQGGTGVLLLQPFESDFLSTLGRDIPITQMEFPDSEIALGLPQQKVFELMYKIMPADLVDEAFISLAGAQIPRASEYRLRKADVLQDLEAWFRDFAGDSAPLPRISPMLMGEGRRRQDSRGFASSSSSSSSSSHYPRHGKSERPARSSERSFGGRRPDASRSWSEQRSQRTSR